MIRDLFGKTRQKCGLHIHTTLSDGRKTPEEAAEIYRRAGFDVIALTDHWRVGENGTVSGLPVLSGCEYNLGGDDTGSSSGVWHIVGLGMVNDPQIPKLTNGRPTPPQTAIDRIHAAGGLAVLAHPAWSLNTAENILPLRDVDATEIYNTVSGVCNSARPDSSLIVDMLANRGRAYPLLATDDVHHYTDDACRSFVMAEAEEPTREAILSAVREGRFYASQGPEIHMRREGDCVIVSTSPVCRIGTYSNLAYAPNRFVRNGTYTEFVYHIRPEERFIRAEAMDADGNLAWTNILWTGNGEVRGET